MQRRPESSPSGEPQNLQSLAIQALQKKDPKGRTYASDVDFNFNKWMFYQKKEKGIEPIREDEVERLIKESMDPNSRIPNLREENKVFSIYGPRGWDDLIYLIGAQKQRRTVKDVLDGFLRVLYEDSVRAIKEDAKPLHALANVAAIQRFIEEGRLTDQVVAANAEKSSEELYQLVQEKTPEARLETARDQAADAVRSLTGKNEQGKSYLLLISEMLIRESEKEGSGLPNWTELRKLINYSVRNYSKVVDPLMIEEGASGYSYSSNGQFSLAYVLEFAKRHKIFLTTEVMREFKNRLISAVIDAKSGKNNRMILHALASLSGVYNLAEGGSLNDGILSKQLFVFPSSLPARSDLVEESSTRSHLAEVKVEPS